MELDEIVAQIGLPFTNYEEFVSYSTESTGFTLREDSVSYMTSIPLTSRHRFNVLAELLPRNILVYNFREWLRKQPLKELGRIQRVKNEGIIYPFAYTEDHIPALVEFIQKYFSNFSTP